MLLKPNPIRDVASRFIERRMTLNRTAHFRGAEVIHLLVYARNRERQQCQRARHTGTGSHECAYFVYKAVKARWHRSLP